MSAKTDLLKACGVEMPSPDQVFVDAEIAPERIAPGVVLMPGVRILGSETSIGPGCVIGSEGPATVQNCQLERDVTLASGFFDHAVFLAGSSMGSAAHVRPACLLEEEANGAHCVGLKQTILMPFVTLGSLINFCDVLMSGGTSRSNHGEVGSSFVHFNCTPHGDKATASIFGDVPNGVMLRSRPVFLGGQGGVIGPGRVAFGTVLAAGQVLREDVMEADQLIIPPPPAPGKRNYNASVYGNIARTVRNGVHYLAQLRALKAWYVAVRAQIMKGNPWSLEACRGAIAQLDAVTAERLKQLDRLSTKIADGLVNPAVPAQHRARHEAFSRHWKKIGPFFQTLENIPSAPETLLALLRDDKPYLEQVRAWPDDAVTAGTQWLQDIVGRGVALGNDLEPGES